MGKKEKKKTKQTKTQQNIWRDVTVSSKDFVAIYFTGELVCVSFPSKFTTSRNEAWSMGKKTKPEVSLYVIQEKRHYLIMEPVKSLATKIPHPACMWNSDLYI